MKNIDVSSSNFTVLGNFEKLKENENYKSGFRNCKNALQIMSIGHACVKSESSIEFDDEITKKVNEKMTSIKKADDVYQKKLNAGRTKILIGHAHDRIARDHIFNKFTEISQDIVKNLKSFSEMGSMLQKKFFNQSYIKIYNFTEQMQLITLSSCDDDIQKYIVKIQSLNKNLNAMNQNESELKFIFKLLMNLKDKFKKYVFRTITQNEMSKFDKIVIDLTELDRMTKHETSFMILRAQNKSLNNNNRNKFKLFAIKFNSEKKCFKCEVNEYDEKNCFVCHSKKKKVGQKKKKKNNKKNKNKKNKKKKNKTDKKIKKIKKKNNINFSKYVYFFEFLTYVEIYVEDVDEKKIIESEFTSAYFFMTFTYAFFISTIVFAVNIIINFNVNFKDEQGLVDSKCSQHMTFCRIDFVNYHKMNKTFDIYIANDAVIKAIEIETIAFETTLFDDTAHTVSLNNVFYAFDLNCELMSNAQLISDETRLIFESDDCFVYDIRSDNSVLHATKIRTQYSLNIIRSESQFQTTMIVFYFSVKINEKILHLGHRRIDYLNEQKFFRLTDMSTDMKLQKKIKKSDSLCSFCMIDKMRKKISRRFQNSVFDKNECLNSNLMNFIDSAIYDDYNYIDMFTCRAIEKTGIYLLKTKDEGYDIIKDVFLSLLKTQIFNHKIKRGRSDEKSEQINKRFQAMLTEKDIVGESSASYAKEQNDIAERKNFIIMNSVRAIMNNANLSGFLGSEIIKTSIYFYNRRSVARLRIQNVISKKIYINIKSNINHYRMIDCDAGLIIFKNQKDQKKLSSREVKCKLIDYVEINQYRLYNFVIKRCITTKNVQFDEFNMLNKKHIVVYGKNSIFENFVSSESDIQSNDTTFSNDDVFDNSENSVQEIARLNARIKKLSLRESSTNVDADDNDSQFFFLNDQSNLVKSDDNIDEDERVLHSNSHSNSTIDARSLKSKMTLNRNSRHKESSTKIKKTERGTNFKNGDKIAKIFVDQEHYDHLCEMSQTAYARMITVTKSQKIYDHDFDSKNDFNDLIQLTQVFFAKTRSFVDEESLILKKAFNDFYSKKFKRVIDVEMSEHKVMSIYKRVKRFSFSFNVKILTFKLMFKVKKNLNDDIIKFKMRGCAREFEQSHDVDFHETYASVVKSMIYKLLFVIIIHHDFDAEQMNIVTIFLNARLKKRNIFIEFSESYEDLDYVGILTRAFYELKQSFKEGYETLNQGLISQNFVRLKFDHFVFINKKTELIVFVYVDDLLIIESRNFKQIVYLKKALSNKFKMTDLNFCHHYLDMKIIKNRNNRTLFISQSFYVQKILTRFNMQNCKSAFTFMNTDIKLEFNKNATIAKMKLYQIMINNLMYLIYQTRSNICFVVICLSRQNMNSSKKIFDAVKKLLRYLKKSANMKIIYDIDTEFENFIDADGANEITSRHSTDAYIFQLYENVISGFFKLQTYVALSSCETKYMTQTQASKKIIGIFRLLKKLNMNFDLSSISITIKIDNQKAIALTKDSKFHSRTKYIDVQWHFVRKQIEKSMMQFEYCSTNEMIADELTKTLNKIKFERFVKMTDLLDMGADLMLGHEYQLKGMCYNGSAIHATMCDILASLNIALALPWHPPCKVAAPSR